MGDIFQEIDEELRRDRLEELWKKYHTHIIILAILIVLATAGWVGWQKYEQSQNVAVTTAMQNAITLGRAGKKQEAIEAFAALTKEGNDRQNALALLQEAGLRAEEGDVESARGLYQSVRENESLGDAYRALATIRAVELDLDRGDPATMLGWLAPLQADDSVWRHVAWELAAFLEMRAGNPDKAKSLLERLRDDKESPAAARARAEAYLAQL